MFIMKKSTSKMEPPMGIILSYKGHLKLWRILQTFLRGKQEDCASPQSEFPNAL